MEYIICVFNCYRDAFPNCMSVLALGHISIFHRRVLSVFSPHWFLNAFVHTSLVFHWPWDSGLRDMRRSGPLCRPDVPIEVYGSLKNHWHHTVWQSCFVSGFSWTIGRRRSGNKFSAEQASVEYRWHTEGEKRIHEPNTDSSWTSSHFPRTSIRHGNVNKALRRFHTVCAWSVIGSQNHVQVQIADEEKIC